MDAQKNQPVLESLIGARMFGVPTGARMLGTRLIKPACCEPLIGAPCLESPIGTCLRGIQRKKCAKTFGSHVVFRNHTRGFHEPLATLLSQAQIY